MVCYAFLITMWKLVPGWMETYDVLARTLDPMGVDCEMPHWLERGTKYFF